MGASLLPMICGCDQVGGTSLARLLASGIWKILLSSHLRLLSHGASVYSEFCFLYLS